MQLGIGRHFSSGYNLSGTKHVPRQVGFQLGKSYPDVEISGQCII